MDGRLFGNWRTWAVAAAYMLLALALYAVLMSRGIAVHPSYWAFAAAFGLLALYLTRRGFGWALLLALGCAVTGALTAAADAVYVLPAAALIAAGLLVGLRGLLGSRSRRPPRR